MSVRIMAQVWDTSPLEGRALLVELALADFANDEGVCWPSIETLSRKARCSESWVHQILREMRKMGRLEVAEAGGRGKTNQYRLRPNAGEKGALSGPFSEKGAVDSAKGCSALHPIRNDPSYNNSLCARDEISDICSAFAQFGHVTAGTPQSVEWAVEDYGAKLVMLAVRSASGAGYNGEPPWSYIDQILRRWEKQGGPDEPKESRNEQRQPATNGAIQRGDNVRGLTGSEYAVLDRLGVLTPLERRLD